MLGINQFYHVEMAFDKDLKKLIQPKFLFNYKT